MKSDMSKERFEASGGVTTTMDYEDKEQYKWMYYVIFSDKIAQLKAQIRLQKEAEAKGEKLVTRYSLLLQIGCKCLPRSYRIPSVHNENRGSVVCKQVYWNTRSNSEYGPYCNFKPF